MSLLNLDELRDYNKWIGQTAWDVYHSVIRVGGWSQVFQGPVPRWASRIRQYFNLTPKTLKLLDHDESSEYLEKAQKALPASARAKAIRAEQQPELNKLQSRGMGISFNAPGSSTRPGTLLIKPKRPDPSVIIDGLGNNIGTKYALSGHVYRR
jgi:hypothetical protein